MVSVPTQRLRNVLLRGFGGTLLLVSAVTSFAATDAKIATASESDTFYAMGQDLAKLIAPDADVNLGVVATSGSAANIRALRSELAVKLAIVQADVMQAMQDRAAAGNADAATLVRPLRVLLPLTQSEVHFIVRADSDMNFVHEIKGARINGGVVGSGAAFTTQALYRAMFDAALPESQASFFSNEEALVKLITDKSVDVVVIVSGQPAPLLANMKPEAQKFIKLLKLDSAHASSKSIQPHYVATNLSTSSYPNLLRDNIGVISVGAWLVANENAPKAVVDPVGKLAKSLCQNFAALQSDGHPKWKEVTLSLPELKPGVAYHSAAQRELKSCTPKVKATKKCTGEERLLGLCR